MVKISAVIITFNEEKNIGRCLDALQDVVDEIVVLDSFSTDRTKEICLHYKALFFESTFSGYVDQKNAALKFANYPYILSVDADEVLSPELRASILKVKDSWDADGYYFNRLTNYCGSWIRHCDWYPDRKLRLWDVRKGKWDGLLIHEKVKLEDGSRVKHLNGDLLHYSYYSIQQHINQANKFTLIMAREAYNKGKKIGVWGLILKPMWRFFQSYLMKAGFLDGYHGFVICVISSFSVFLKIVNLRELHRNEKK